MRYYKRLKWKGCRGTKTSRWLISKGWLAVPQKTIAMFFQRQQQRLFLVKLNNAGPRGQDEWGAFCWGRAAWAQGTWSCCITWSADGLRRHRCVHVYMSVCDRLWASDALHESSHGRKCPNMCGCRGLSCCIYEGTRVFNILMQLWTFGRHNRKVLCICGLMWAHTTQAWGWIGEVCIHVNNTASGHECNLGFVCVFSCLSLSLHMNMDSICPCMLICGGGALCSERPALICGNSLVFKRQKITSHAKPSSQLQSYECNTGLKDVSIVICIYSI